jgi:hypothetical protein
MSQFVKTKLILRILSDLEPLRGSPNKKTLYSTRPCVIWAFFWHSWIFKTRFTRVLKWPRRAKKAQLTHERVEYNVFLFDEPLKGSK